MTRPTRIPRLSTALAALLLCAALLTGGCASYATKQELFRQQYGAGDFPAARAELDRRILEESGPELDPARPGASSN